MLRRTWREVAEIIKNPMTTPFVLDTLVSFPSDKEEMEADMQGEEYSEWRHEERATETEIDDILAALREWVRYK